MYFALLIFLLLPNGQPDTAAAGPFESMRACEAKMAEVVKKIPGMPVAMYALACVEVKAAKTL